MVLLKHCRNCRSPRECEEIPGPDSACNRHVAVNYSESGVADALDRNVPAIVLDGKHEARKYPKRFEEQRRLEVEL